MEQHYVSLLYCFVLYMNALFCVIMLREAVSTVSALVELLAAAVIYYVHVFISVLWLNR